MSQSEHAPYFPETGPPQTLESPNMLSKVRSIIFFGLLTTITLVMGILLLPVHLFGERAVRRAIKYWARLIMILLKVTCGISYRLIGKENVPRNAAIIAANHQSMWETIALFDILPNPVLVFKKELLTLPIYRWWGRGGGGMVVDRDAGMKAIKALNAEAKKKIDEGAQVVIFPEGTRAPAGTIGELKPGIAGLYKATAASCTPVRHNSGNHWRHPGPWKTPGQITIEFLVPIESGLQRKPFMTILDSVLRGKTPPSVDEKSSPS